MTMDNKAMCSSVLVYVLVDNQVYSLLIGPNIRWLLIGPNVEDFHQRK